jgi:hypothetical protein
MKSSHLIALIIGSTSLLACEGRKQPSPEKPIDPAHLQPGPIRHPQLTEAQLDRIGKLQQTLLEVDPSPLDRWIDDFKRDSDPEREIQIYEGMASAYSAYCTGRTLTLAAKQDVYQVVILRSGAPDTEVLPRLKLHALSVDDARDVLKLYRMDPMPITVSTAREAR